ncbi:MAG: ATP-binding protein [Victivallaceae bacterium]|nr:ATP-binding protein [Victivallaceae bacterium]
MWVKRKALADVLELLAIFPVVAILGPRQCGKTSLARKLLKNEPSAVILDMELPSEQRKLTDPELFFEANRDKIICLDEIQRVPEIFPVVRAEIDKLRKPGRFIILGSASPELIRQISESLAGRICYYELTPFIYQEVVTDMETMRNLWIRGGFPNSYLAASERAYTLWLRNFIKTYVERDIPQLGFNIDSNRLIKLLTLCAHQQGQLLNFSKLAQIIETSSQTVRNYLEIMTGTFILRILSPITCNIKKRLVKSPKIYFRDQGIFHQLLEIDSFNDLLSNVALGSSWEGFAIEQIISCNPEWKYYFYRTSNGAEIDLIIEHKGKKVAVEFKCSKSPKISKGFYQAIVDLDISDAWCVIPALDSYRIGQVTVAGLGDFIDYISQH